MARSRPAGRTRPSRLPERSGSEAEPAAGRGREIPVGRVSGLFGVKGWVKLFSFTEPRERLLEYEPLLLGEPGSWRTVRLAEAPSYGEPIEAFDSSSRGAIAYRALAQEFRRRHGRT